MPSFKRSEPEGLKWRKAEPNRQVSRCGRYRVARNGNGGDMNCRWFAYEYPDDFSIDAQGHDTRAEAKRLCEEIEAAAYTAKPCPCCGESSPIRWCGEELFGLDVGRRSSDSMGVSCKTCGLRMERSFPDDWPPYTKRLKVDESMAAIERETLKQAVAAWNRRI